MFGSPGSLGGLNATMNQSDPASSSRSKTGPKKVMFDPKAAANITADIYMRDQLINGNLNNMNKTTEEEQYAFEAKVKEMTEMVMKDYKRRKSELKPIAE
jgi:hypothetical protein